MQLYKALSASTASLPVPCTEHQLKKKKNQYTAYSQKRIFTNILISTQQKVKSTFLFILFIFQHNKDTQSPCSHVAYN